MAISTELRDPRKCSGNAILILIYAWIFQFTVISEKVSPDDYPFLATLMKEDEAKCGATLITTTFLFTACRCLLTIQEGPHFMYPQELLDPESIYTVAGNISEKGQTRVAKKVQVHPKCEGNASAVVYNYGLIEVKDPFHLKPGSVEVVAFFGKEDVIRTVIQEPKNLNCYSLDFELIQRGDSFWNLGSLMKEDVKLKNGDWCANTFSEDLKSMELAVYPDLQVCVTQENSSGECERADRGGLLICSTGEDELPIGLSSGKARPYCGKGVPQVYSRVDVGIGWVHEILEPDGNSTGTVEPTRSSTEANGTTIGPTDPTFTMSVYVPDIPQYEMNIDGITDNGSLDNSCFSLSSGFRLIIFTTSMAVVVSPV
ncbi:hypothetical protein GE061_018991 [Apolygus lucorum]|uniref:Peptidase S1 domain-containing protein n=1 Tax=Apolygus lucorum TaxID=248454 RepID=A0A8S9X907_APOLU|nr:hypothetical protein GE061_018991 [Apolygus lucorum]